MRFLFLIFLFASGVQISFGDSTSTKVIPLPIYSTLPNEGSTFGFMPVFMNVEEKTERTKSIIAPSFSWNKLIRFTGTYRHYAYPSDIEVINFIPSISTNVNKNLTLEYFRLPRTPRSISIEAGLHVRRSLFYRFFGVGPFSGESDESSYTRTGGDLGARVNYNFTTEWSAGVRVVGERHLVERLYVSYLPLTNAKHPTTPGLQGATSVSEFAYVKYDSRSFREYSDEGFFSELGAGALQPLSSHIKPIGKFYFQTKAMWQETSFLQGAARFYSSYSEGNEIPFYHLSTLGGSFFLRGFTEDRFIDKGAWEFSLEQRLTVWRMRIMGVTADWRIDPFLNFGQVYPYLKDAFSQMKWASGIGFRAFVRPNVLGRVDVAYGGEGPKVYVELGYPF